MGESLSGSYHIFYENDCVLVEFEPVESLQGLYDYSPFPSDTINCDFASGDVTCEKLSDF